MVPYAGRAVASSGGPAFVFLPPGRLNLSVPAIIVLPPDRLKVSAPASFFPCNTGAGFIVRRPSHPLYGDRRTASMTAAGSAAGGRRTMTFTGYCHMPSLKKRAASGLKD